MGGVQRISTVQPERPSRTGLPFFCAGRIAAPRPAEKFLPPARFPPAIMGAPVGESESPDRSAGGPAPSAARVHEQKSERGVTPRAARGRNAGKVSRESVRFKGSSPAGAAGTSPAPAVRQPDDVPGWGRSPLPTAGRPPGREKPVPANPTVLISTPRVGGDSPGTLSEAREVLLPCPCTGLGRFGDRSTLLSRARTSSCSTTIARTNAPTANRRATRRAIRRAALALCAPSSAGQDRAERLRRTTIERQPPDDLKHHRRRGGGWMALEGFPPPGEA
jgi:hypothetical protein